MAFVYLIRNGDLHKIGRTDNLKRRMKQLEPDEVVQVLETDRSRDLEYELHQQFKAKRLPQSEYFRLDEAEVAQAIAALGGPGEAFTAAKDDKKVYDLGHFGNWYASSFGIALIVTALLRLGDAEWSASIGSGLGVGAFPLWCVMWANAQWYHRVGCAALAGSLSCIGWWLAT